MAKLMRQRSRKEVRNATKEWELKQEEQQRENFARINDARSTFYAGIDPRRRREVADSGMVQEDPRAIANLSTVPIHREYTRFGFYSTPYIDDTELD
jgi:hypothetical protein